ncbi:protein FAM219A-like [Saccoglossus kowalevskii]|uniref:Protein FAM219A-like n=1 Tax=Saccoglossus kowalevskii TaxID=10224 RepID=A0ABM0M219_SACKO|nr:PREDICTED: protein FAM219A-like [Saccoglossus kowalevskii]
MAETDGVLVEPSIHDRNTHEKQNGNIEKTNGYTPLKTILEPSLLQKRIEKQRELTRKSQQSSTIIVVDQQPKKSILPRNRLPVPSKITSMEYKPDEQPLVSLDSDSDDEFDISKLPSQINIDLNQQLLKDGYRLDELPDDEDLDLIPPKSFNQRCVCCQLHQTLCTIQ